MVEVERERERSREHTCKQAGQSTRQVDKGSNGGWPSNLVPCSRELINYCLVLTMVG